jgi:hypothetical protein
MWLTLIVSALLLEGHSLRKKIVTMSMKTTEKGIKKFNKEEKWPILDE